jgi:hypothetical protein
MNARTATFMLIATWLLATVSALPQIHMQAQFQMIGRLDEKTLAAAVPDPRIQAYDLSPDGTQLALFVASGDLIQAPSWIIIVGAADLKVVNKVHFGTGRLDVQGYAPQLAFSPDGKSLVAEDGQVVRVLETKNLKTTRTITSSSDRVGVPAGLMMASKSDVVAVSFGTGDPVQNYMAKRTIQTEMVDISSGKLVSSWTSDDIPFSVSANAGFVAVSDHDSVGSVMGVAILNAMSGAKVYTLTGGYAFTNAPGGNGFITRIVAKFIGDDEVVLTPDGNRDQAGYDVGQSIKLVRLKDSKVLQEISPEHYGPTGELAVSADQNVLVSISRYVAPKYLTHHRPVPRDTRPDLVMLSKQKVFTVTGVQQLPELLALRKRGLFDTSYLRVSADGSLISVAEGYGVTVFATR